MSPFPRRLAAATALAALALLAPTECPAQTPRGEIEAVVRDYLAKHPDEVQRIVKDYLLKNPEVIQDAFGELMKRRAAATTASATDKAAAIKSNAKLLFDSPRQVTLGNRQGDVTLVEFLDYNCGYCKRASTDLLTLLNDDPKLRVVLKEWPVLGSASTQAAQVAVAVRMQDPTGEKYLAFHQKLLGERGPANKARATAAAQEVGLDLTRLEQDLASAEVRETLEENAKLARALGIKGTPGYVIGDTVVPGAAGVVVLKETVQAARGRPAN
jgi:protein-disulfide isomerase